MQKSNFLICVWTKEQSTKMIPTMFTTTVQFKNNISITLASIYICCVEKMTQLHQYMQEELLN